MYWSIIKSTFLGKNVPLIPPLLVNCNFITEFKEKTELFNSYFAKQCRTMSSDHKLSQTITFYTNERLSSFDFDINNVIKIIKNFAPKKAHGYDNSII